MIKKQYILYPRSGYFGNFMNTMSYDWYAIEEVLRKYNATISKSKNRNNKLNVKWHDLKLYSLFVLRWA